jgi:hypothetical protein
VKSTASSNDIQKKNRVLKYIILFCFVFLKDFAFFSSFSSSSFFFFFFFFFFFSLSGIFTARDWK